MDGLSSLSFRDNDTERELELTNWIRENSINMWIGVTTTISEEDGSFNVLISHVDERLAIRAGYFTPHTSLLRKELSVLMSDTVDPREHDKLCGTHIEEGHGPLPLTRTNPEKFKLKHRDGSEHAVIVNARVLEAKFCKGFCTNVEGETVKKYGMAEITYVEDLPRHVREAMAQYQERQND